MTTNRDTDLYQLVYHSHGLLGDEPDAIAAAIANILHTARTHNPTVDITGILTFSGRNFAQALEGRRADLQDLMARIMADTRHRDVLIVQDSQIAERDFAGWAMAYTDASSSDPVHLSAESDVVGFPAAGHGRIIVELLRYLAHDSETD